MISRGIRLCPASQIGCEENLLTACAARWSRFVIVSAAATFPRLLSNDSDVSCRDTAGYTGMEIPEVKERKMLSRHTREAYASGDSLL